MTSSDNYLRIFWQYAFYKYSLGRSVLSATEMENVEFKLLFEQIKLKINNMQIG